MYKVLIVDDEAPARGLLKMKVDWSSIDCEVIGEAKNGQEAFSLYENLKPDLIITDIEMPVMNGLELITKIRETDKRQAIIILSCHESFSFARKAIQLNVKDYLIKDSFETEELYAIITDMFKDREHSLPTQAVTLQSPDDNKRSIATKQLITEDLSKALQSSLIKDYTLDINHNSLVLLYIDIEIVGLDVTDLQSHYLNDTDIQLIQNMLRASIGLYSGGEVCHDRDNIFLVLCGVSNCHSQMECRRESIALANHIRHIINEGFSVQTTIGISQPIIDLAYLTQAYKEAFHAGNRKIISGYDKTYISNAQTSTDDDHYTKILNVKLNRIGDYLLSNNFGPITKEVTDIFLQNLKGYMQYNYLKHTNWTLLGMLIDYCTKNNIAYAEVFDSRSPWETIMEIKTVDGMCRWFIGSINKLSSHLTQEEDSSYSYHVSKCIKYIHQNYNQNIGLKELAEKYDINNAYLSRIFKKETGSSLTDYVNGIRVNEAKKLILETNKKMYEIAELTGFNSNQRFFSTFKKIEGISPGDYRKQ